MVMIIHIVGFFLQNTGYSILTDALYMYYITITLHKKPPQNVDYINTFTNFNTELNYIITFISVLFFIKQTLCYWD